MNRFVVVVAAGFGLMAQGAEAQPIVATLSGIVSETGDPFTAAFHYDTVDLVPSPDNASSFDARSGSSQWATYTVAARSVTFDSADFFSIGEYPSVVYDPDGSGAVDRIDTAHAYTIAGSAGLLSLTFGGADTMGLVTFGRDGVDYATLEPDSFSSSGETVSPVPLPGSALLFGGAVMLLGFASRARTSKA